jgi:hypothetical protein
MKNVMDGLCRMNGEMRNVYRILIGDLRRVTTWETLTKM